MTATKDTIADNLMLIVGQLMEAAKAASEGLKSLGQEMKDNSTTIAGAQLTIEQLDKAVMALEHLVSGSDNKDSLILRSYAHAAALEDLTAALKDLSKAVDDLESQISSVSSNQTNNKAKWYGASKATLIIGAIVGWVITTVIAVYAAVSQAGK